MPEKIEEKRVFSVGRLIDNNKFALVFSLLLAIIIWVTVSPERTNINTVPLNVSTEGTAVGQLGLEVVEGQGQMVDVKIEGKWYVISELNESNIRLSVPFTNITKAGVQELRVSASLTGTAADVTILSVVPETVKLTFDTVQELPFTITPKVNGATAAEGLVAGLPVLSDETVSIKAAKSVLDSIGEVVAQVDVNKTLSKSESYTVALKVYDNSGAEIDLEKLSMDISEVTVTQPINKTKSLAVEASFKNQPAYYKSTPLKYSVNPATINVVGDVDLVDGIDKITLDPIDFALLSPTNNKFTYPVSLPQGITSVDDVKQVTVSVDMTGIKTAQVDVTRFVGKNVPEGSVAAATITSKTVTVAGNDSAISALTANDVYLEFDLSTLGSATGERVVNATLKSDKYNNVWGVGQIEIQISISSK